MHDSHAHGWHLLGVGSLLLGSIGHLPIDAILRGCASVGALFGGTAALGNFLYRVWLDRQSAKVKGS